jgi:tetratricopeptide (TPR) repeat protein
VPKERSPKAVRPYAALLHRLAASKDVEIEELRGQTALRARERLADLLLEKGTVLIESDEGLQCFNEVIGRFSDAPEPSLRMKYSQASLLKGRALQWYHNKPEEALSTFDEVIARFADAPDPELRLAVAEGITFKAQALQRMGRTAEALATFGTVIEELSNEAEHRLVVQRAEALFNEGRHVEALDLIHFHGRVDQIANIAFVIRAAERGIPAKYLLNATWPYTLAGVEQQWNNVDEPTKIAYLGGMSPHDEQRDALDRDLDRLKIEYELGFGPTAAIEAFARRASAESGGALDPGIRGRAELNAPSGRVAETKFVEGPRSTDAGVDLTLAELNRRAESDPGNALNFIERGNTHFARRDYDRAIEDFIQAGLIAKGVPESTRASVAAKIQNLVISRKRVPWDERYDHKELRHLTAPKFLKAVYPDALDASGRLSNEEIVRASDPKLVQIVQGYINTRAERGLDLGDAEGLAFVKKDNRGRPKKPKGRGRRAIARSPL